MRLLLFFFLFLSVLAPKVVAQSQEDNAAEFRGALPLVSKMPDIGDLGLISDVQELTKRAQKTIEEVQRRTTRKQQAELLPDVKRDRQVLSRRLPELRALSDHLRDVRSGIRQQLQNRKQTNPEAYDAEIGGRKVN
jgi:primase-polymerase (primpol)-like protein